MLNSSRATTRYVLQVSIFILFFAACLFIASGRLYWIEGWVFIAIVTGTYVCIIVVLMTNNPELMGERAEIKGKRDFDRILASIISFYGIVSICVVAGLNVRFGWLPQFPLIVQVGGVLIALLGSTLTVWAMASNKFFYGVLRVAQDKGHTVCARGPYRYIRHPGYLGMILGDLATPLILNSLWALIPVVLTVCAIVIRTALEDRALQNRLGGYKDYAQQVCYRLVPVVW